MARQEHQLDTTVSQSLGNLTAEHIQDHRSADGAERPRLVPAAGKIDQAVADLLTMRQEWGALAGCTVCWVGDFNNVARSLSLGAALFGMSLRVASPAGYGPTDADLDRLAQYDCTPFVTTHPEEAAKGADAVHTDVFTSMGAEAEAQERHRAFEGFQVDDTVLAAASAKAIFMHCLPAHRGEEVSASVADGPQSRIFKQAHNRMHSFRGLVSWLVEENGR